VPESLLINGGDLLSISVFDHPELDQRKRVSDAGDVQLSLIGKLHVAGMTPAEASEKIEHSLQEGDFIRRPQVQVLVEQFAAANVSVTGQVLHPGSYPLMTPTDLMYVISMAGGLTPTAEIHVTVKRSGPTGETLHATLSNDPNVAIHNSVMVRPGDLVIVPKAGIIFVLGDVSRPGGYVMQYDARLTALQAIALAGGMTKTSAENKVRLVHQPPSGAVEQLLAVNAMEKGKQPDVQLQPEDVIYVPYSTAKNLMLGAGAILSSTTGAAIYAAR
jgi:polysaccharide biosynthesis/export protein